MAHFAQLDENNIVTQVIVINKSPNITVSCDYRIYKFPALGSITF